ncbi:MAG: DUF1211 domain-containing protein [Actinobacteria bacterium]|nr:MAG: DUF1211 domain-containing protein [Actinomycetota bacterium]
MPTARLETFADGVFAIAATLLIIDVTADAEGGALGAALTHAWPQYVAYAVSFVTIGIMWVNHHAMLEHFSRADRRFLFLNVLFLMCIAFAPFPTALVAEHLHSTTAALVYGTSFMVTAVMFNAIWHYGRLHLLRPDADPRAVSGITRSYLPGPLMYGGSALVAFASPVASIALYGAIACVYVLSETVWGRAA